MTIRISDFTIDTTPIAQQVIDVKAYAAENYKRHGWDFVVECYTDAELVEAIGKRKNSRSAINAMYAIVKPQDEARRGARAEAGEDAGKITRGADDKITGAGGTVIVDEQAGMEAGERIAAQAEAAALTDDKAAIDAKAAARREARRLAQRARRVAARAA